MAQAPKALKTSSWQFTVKKLIQCSLKHRILRSEETWTPFSFQDWLDHPVNVVRPQSFQLVCQGHNIDFIPSTHAECPTHKVNSVFLDVQLLPKKAHSASVKRTAYHRDPGVWVGETEGTTTLAKTQHCQRIISKVVNINIRRGAVSDCLSITAAAPKLNYLGKFGPSCLGRTAM